MTTLTTPSTLGAPDSYAAHEMTAVSTTQLTFRHNAKTRILLWIAGILTFVAVAVIGLHAYAAWALAHPPVEPLQANPMLAKSLSYNDIAFYSADQSTLLDAWWIPATNSAQTVILSHGYGTNREEFWVPMYDLAELLHQLNYNVMMFDYAFANKRLSSAATGGIREAGQLLGAVQFAREQRSEQIAIWGFSMGAGTALQAALREEAQIDAMILDSLFIPDEDTLYYNLRQYANLPKYPAVSLVRHFFPLMSGERLESIPSALLQHTSFSMPIMLIHGTADTKSPLYLAENIAHAQHHPLSQLWVVPDSLHEMIFRTHPEDYVQRTTAFLQEALQPPGLPISN